MKKKIRIALLAAMAATLSAQASEFDGGFVGARAGLNRSDISGLVTAGKKNAAIFGIDGGYNWGVGRFLLGVDVFADSNGKADHDAAVAPFTTNYGSFAFGIDLKLGLPMGSWLPYARLGYVHTRGTGNASSFSCCDSYTGVGIEYKYTPNWGVNAEWSTSFVETDGSKLNNDNLTVGIKYYFATPKAAPVPASH